MIDAYAGALNGALDEAEADADTEPVASRIEVIRIVTGVPRQSDPA